LPMAVAGISKIVKDVLPQRELQTPPASWTEPQAGQMFILIIWRESRGFLIGGERSSSVIGQP